MNKCPAFFQAFISCSRIFMVRKKGFKQVVLLIAGTAVIAGMFALPPYKKWWTERLFRFWKEFQRQKTELAIEKRKRERFRTNYDLCRQIAAPFANRPDKNNIVILMPPEGYFKKEGVSYNVCEPGIFYYLTGTKTVLVNSPDAEKANWYVRIMDKHIVVDSVIDKNSLTDIIASYKKFL